MTLLLRTVRSRLNLQVVLNQLATCSISRTKCISSYHFADLLNARFSTSSNCSARLSRMPISVSDPAEPIIDTDHVITVPLHLKKRLEKKIILQNTKRVKRQQSIDASRQGRKTVCLQLQSAFSNL